MFALKSHRIDSGTELKYEHEKSRLINGCILFLFCPDYQKKNDGRTVGKPEVVAAVRSPPCELLLTFVDHKIYSLTTIYFII